MFPIFMTKAFPKVSRDLFLCNLIGGAWRLSGRLWPIRLRVAAFDREGHDLGFERVWIVSGCRRSASGARLDLSNFPLRLYVQIGEHTG